MEQLTWSAFSFRVDVDGAIGQILEHICVQVSAVRHPDWEDVATSFDPSCGSYSIVCYKSHPVLELDGASSRSCAARERWEVKGRAAGFGDFLALGGQKLVVDANLGIGVRHCVLGLDELLLGDRQVLDQALIACGDIS